jgi:hypothetical protein
LPAIWAKLSVPLSPKPCSVIRAAAPDVGGEEAVRQRHPRCRAEGGGRVVVDDGVPHSGVGDRVLALTHLVRAGEVVETGERLVVGAGRERVVLVQFEDDVPARPPAPAERRSAVRVRVDDSAGAGLRVGIRARERHRDLERALPDTIPSNMDDAVVFDGDTGDLVAHRCHRRENRGVDRTEFATVRRRGRTSRGRDDPSQ